MTPRLIAAPLLGPLMGLCLASPALAVLPPFYDSGSQIEAVLGSREVASAVGNAPILGLQAVKPKDEAQRAWQVKTARCTLVVTLDALAAGAKGGAPGMVGPTTYRVARIGACGK